MDHTEKLTRYTANFIDELAFSGLRHVVISPGSRSTPLAMLMHKHKEIQDWVIVDERSAAFFALGIAKKLQEPVALVCTSGTAAANYYPAIVEAKYSRVPLVVLTADRPHELRGIGASQTIDQINLFGKYVKDFLEMALPETEPHMLDYVRNRAARAVRVARQENAGPVHVNFPFREPLVPNMTLPALWGERTHAYNRYSDGKKRLPSQQIEQLAATFSGLQKGLIVCGPQVEKELVPSLVRLSEKLGAPILADPTSQCRAGTHEKGHIISAYDAILKNKEMRALLKPDYILRFGAMPISKSYLFFIQEHNNCLQYVVENREEMREPTNHESTYLFSDGIGLCEDLMNSIEKNHNHDWLTVWQEYDHLAAQMADDMGDARLTEGETIRLICSILPEQSDLFVANSMPVRDLDSFFFTSEKEIVVHANRGVSGIDGITSTALGIAAVSRKRMTLIIGDLSFYHDLNGLWAAKQYGIDLTIVLLNNNGGGIFSFLPQADEKDQFEALFGTPLHLDFEKTVMMYEGRFTTVNERSAFEHALSTSYATPGLSVIEVCTDRTENALWHRKYWDKVIQGLMDHDQTKNTANR